MSTSSNISQSTYSPSEPETPQVTTQNRIQNFDQSLNHVDIGLSIEQSMKSAQKEMHQKRIQALRKELDYLKSTEWEFDHDKGFNDDEDDDDQKEDFLADQLLELEIVEDKENENKNTITNEIPRNALCFQRTGVITHIDDNHIIIDGVLYFELAACSLNLHISDKILYLGYRDVNESIIIVRILDNYGMYWGDENFEENVEEDSFTVKEHVIIGEVDCREDRFVYIKDESLKFNLDDVEATLVPVKGDWLELKCNVQWNDERPFDVKAAQVLKVISIKPLRSKVISAVITEWSGDIGTCDRQIYLSKQCIHFDAEPKVGTKVMVEAVESNQGPCSWRAIKIITMETESKLAPTVTHNKEEISLTLEKQRKIEVTYPLKFDKVNIDETASITLNITNNSGQIHYINKWTVLSKMRDSQVNISPILERPAKLSPRQTLCFDITCKPKFLGKSKEHIIIMFRGFKVNRYIEINVVNDVSDANSGFNSLKSEHKKVEIMKRIRSKNDTSFVPGVKSMKPPAFIPVRIGTFIIPERIWSTVLGDSEQSVYSSDYEKIIARIEMNLPCLSQDLNINNYIDRWHALLYIEEIQANINMRVYDMPKVFLIRCQEYLSVELEGLAERRPSLVQGDRVIVKDIWDISAPQYEGYIHDIKGDVVFMKFHPRFHESYSGSDVSIEFHFNRATYRRSHQAVNLAISNLGPDILFPSRIITKILQIRQEKLESLTWFNQNLNSGQKSAVLNILLGECRPLPYCIYGPPGTGKTVTIIETILQILTLLPESRILVATPSNSAANLITEKLIGYRDKFADSIIRLIAHYLLESDSIPEIIKPFCATLDIAKEKTVKSKHVVNDDGINLNCQTTYIGRHRVTIGTCYCLGSLAQMGLPRGHFTHVIVDEAGQANEPEIMIPMTFIDKQNGQIILAGDPMQLGPVIMSRYCKEFGMDESYLSRVLESFPYQKDYDAYKTGYNNKLVTKLIDNYRSLQEVITLPSEMFYDGSLMENIDRNQPWIIKLLQVVSEVFNLDDAKAGGIYVYGIRGCNARAEDSPSWYNPQEASMVALTVCKLFKKNVMTDDIGIVTPYIAQIKYLRVLFDAMGLPQPKIGTVEEFQGQERPIIIISTVRTTESNLQEDKKNVLGIVKNPKRLNVALTRAQLAVFLFCDPHLLSKDRLWQIVINQAVKDDKYVGCDLPSVFDYNSNLSM